MLGDAVTGNLHVVQICHDVANISDLQPSEGILPGPVTPRPDHHGLRPDLPGSEPGPGPVGGGRVHRDPHHAGVQLGRLLQAGDGEPHEGGDTSGPGQVILVGREVEISTIKVSAKWSEVSGLSSLRILLRLRNFSVTPSLPRKTLLRNKKI